jgi:hypothetical protein
MNHGLSFEYYTTYHLHTKRYLWSTRVGLNGRTVLISVHVYDQDQLDRKMIQNSIQLNEDSDQVFHSQLETKVTATGSLTQAVIFQAEYFSFRFISPF